MALFDDAMFAPNPGIPGWLGDLLKMMQANPTPSQGFQKQPDAAQLPPNAEPAIGMMPRMGAQQPQGAMPVGAMPEQMGQPYSLGPMPFSPQMGGMPPGGMGGMQMPQGGGQQAQMRMPQQAAPFFGEGGGLQNKLYEMAGIMNPSLAPGLNAIQNRAQLAQSQRATYQSLIDSGVPEPTARAAALNPEVLKTIAGSTFDTKPQFGVIGQNKYGQNQYGFIEPAKRTVTPAQPVGAQQSTADNSDLTGQDYLNSLDKGEQAIVKGMLEGRMQPPSSFALKSPLWSKRLEDAATVEPGFDMTKWTARVSGNKDFYGGGKSSEMVRAANQTIHHVGALVDSMDKLNNTQYPMVNTVGNIFNTKVMGKGAVTEFLPNAHAVAEEMSKVFKGANLSDAEIRQWEASLNQDMSPEQQRAAVGKLMTLLNGSLQALENKRKDSLGEALSAQKGPLLDKESQSTLEKVNKWIAGQKPAGPDQQRSAVPVPEQRRVGEVYDTPKGKARWMGNGWQLVQ